MRIIGVDCSLRITGFGVIENDNGKYNVLDAGIISTTKIGGSANRYGGKTQNTTLPERLNHIHTRLTALLNTWNPDVLVLEEVYSHYKHPRTSILMSHARGTVCLAASEKNIPVIGYSATRVKKAVAGTGGASKTQINRMIQNLLCLKEPPENEDISDALALALTHAYISSKDDITHQRNT